MILHQMRMLNGKVLFEGRMKLVRHSDRSKRSYAKMRSKRWGGRLSELQKQFAEDMKRLNQNYVCLWSKEDIDKWIV